MAKGTVKFFLKKKGFGFIIDDETQTEIFFHITGLKDRNALLKPNDAVIYELAEDQKGKFAKDIEKV